MRASGVHGDEIIFLRINNNDARQFNEIIVSRLSSPEWLYRAIRILKLIYEMLAKKMNKIFIKAFHLPISYYYTFWLLKL